MRVLLPLIVCCVLSPLASAQDPRVTTVDVAPGIYMLQGNGGNIGLSVGADGAFLIDAQYAPGIPQVRAAVAKLTESPIRFVVNTHWHGDHTGGNERLAAAGAVLIAHANVRERMSVDHFVAEFDRTFAAAPAAALPVVTFDDDVTLHYNGDVVRAFHVPRAHTDGDVLIHFANANVMHLGDVFFNGFYPYIDLSTDGSLAGLIKAVDVALDRADDRTAIIPGHGPLADRPALQRYRAMLGAVHQRIAALVEQGKSVEEVVAAAPTAEWDADWGGGFIKPARFVKIACQSIQRDRRAPADAVRALRIRNARWPVPGLLTAGQPTPEQFDALRARGYFLINLREAGERGTGWEEERAVGGGYARLPLSVRDGMTVENANALAALMKTAGDAPICVYCGSANRVGVMLGLKARHVDGVPAADALAFGEAAGATQLAPLLRKKLGL